MKHRALASRLFVVFLGLGFLLAGCGPKPKPRMGFFLDISKNSLEQIDKDGVRISVKPITMENYISFSRIFTNLGAEGPTGSTTTPWIDVNIPAFELTVLNNTGHVLKLSKTVIKVQDDLGTIYESSTKADLEAMTDARAQKLADEQVKIDISAAKARIKALKLADQNLELLPGIAEKVYATFNYPVEPSAFLAGKSFLKLMLYEVPVLTDEAGEVTRTTNFEFVYDIHTRAVGAAR